MRAAPRAPCDRTHNRNCEECEAGAPHDRRLERRERLEQAGDETEDRGRERRPGDQALDQGYGRTTTRWSAVPPRASIARAK
jgi:hypothetical protein